MRESSKWRAGPLPWRSSLWTSLRQRRWSSNGNWIWLTVNAGGIVACRTTPHRHKATQKQIGKEANMGTKNCSTATPARIPQNKKIKELK
eukprot:6368626-Amphidinium_carterae.1